MEHYELVQEMGSVERMATQERLKHARKRRAQQMKKWAQYERQLEKENTKKKKHQDKLQPQKPPKKSNKGNIKFAPNIALLEAAARNDLNEVKKLLESGVSPDVTNEDGLTALHQCCIDDSEDMMKLLLDYNANVNACDSEMWTPLHAAATCGHMMLCKHLIDSGAELLAVNADGNMPYDICEDEVTLDHIETEMANRGITQEQIDMTRLSAEHQMLTDVKEFASKGGDLETVDHMGATLLHIASANGYIEVAEFLLDNHVSVDSRDNDSWQPVHAAAFWAQQEILEMLVECGADLDVKTKYGETPFDLCDEPDLKQKILDMKDEIENKRSIRQQRLGSQRKHRINSRTLGQSSDSLYSSNSSLNQKTSVSASMRRSSMRGDKSQLFKKEHKEEALHFGLNLMQDDDCLMETEEEQDTIPSTDLDEVTIVITSEDDREPASSVDEVDSATRPVPPPAAVTTITINNPTPKPHNQSNIDISTSPQSLAPADGQKAPPQTSPRSQKKDPPADVHLMREPPPDKGPRREFSSDPAPRREPPPESLPRRESPPPSRPRREPPDASRGPSSESGSRRPPSDADSRKETTVNAGSRRRPPPDVAPRRVPPSDAGPSRGPPPDAGPSRGPLSDGGPDRGPPPDVGPRRRPPPDVDPRRGPSSDVGPRRGPSSDVGPRRGPSSDAGPRSSQGATQNVSAPRAANPQSLPRQPVRPAVSNERRQSGSTLSDLKRQRSNSRESLLDLAVQNMFLESVQGGRQPQSGCVQGYSAPVVGRDKTKNGYNNNNSTMQYSASDGQMRRYVAPTHSPVVGADERKQNCCVIL